MEKAIFTTLRLKAIGNNNALKNQLHSWCKAHKVAPGNQFIVITATSYYLFSNYRTKITLQ
jgi:hypothetical protein